MPIGAVGASLISAGLSAAGTTAGIAATGKLNKKNRAWQEHMWNKTNEYNHPVSQMQRFKDAGLNPHLMYGQGDNGNTSMPQAPKQEVPNYNFADAAMAYVSTKKQQTEIDNMQKAQEVMEADKILKSAQTQNTLSASAKTDQEVLQAGELFQTVKATADANLNSLNASIKKIGVETEAVVKQMAATDASIKLSQAQISKISQDVEESAQRIQVLKADQRFKDAETERVRIENKFRNLGINPNAPPIQKLLYETFKPMIDEAKQGVKDFQRDPKKTFMRPLKPWMK